MAYKYLSLTTYPILPPISAFIQIPKQPYLLFRWSREVILCLHLHLHFCSNPNTTQFLFRGDGSLAPSLSLSPLLFFLILLQAWNMMYHDISLAPYPILSPSPFLFKSHSNSIPTYGEGSQSRNDPFNFLSIENKKFTMTPMAKVGWH